jgi:hypothetical protein
VAEWWLALAGRVPRQIWRRELARFAWRRADDAARATRDATWAWSLCKALWKSDSAGFFALTRAPEGSAALRGAIDGCEALVRERVLEEIGKAFSSIKLSSLARRVGLSEADALVAVESRGWTVAKPYVRPCPDTASGSGSSSSSDAAALTLAHLDKLTRVVSELERPYTSSTVKNTLDSFSPSSTKTTGAAAASSSSHA